MYCKNDKCIYYDGTECNFTECCCKYDFNDLDSEINNLGNYEI